MKLETKTHDVSVNGMQNQRKFTVDAGAHIMAVLSGLYKNPVDAMVREYTTNMYDAYVALKRARPDATITAPVLHAPTALDGNLTFRDYGIGMSLDTVWSVYSTYGASTKNGSNDEVGGFGLGSKTAFCYNGGASWSIESRFEGQKHIFMAFIGEDGTPNLTHVTSMPTDEHSGLTISIPIRREDHRAVHEAVAKYAPHFPMPLTVEGVTVKPVEYLFKTDTWALRQPTNRHHASTTVIMGNVPYVLDWSGFGRIMPKCKGAEEWVVRDFITMNNITLFVNIGDVDIVPSRDDMKYTDKTKAALTKAFETMMQELGNVVGQTLDACPTEWDAIMVYSNIKSVIRLHDVVRTVLWRGKRIVGLQIDRKLEDLTKLDPAATVTRYAVTSSDRATIEISVTPADLVVGPYNNSYLIIDDLPKGGALMARALIHQKLVYKNGSGRASRYGHTPGHALLIKSSLTKAQLSTLFGGFPVKDILSATELKGTVPVPATLKDIKDSIYRWNDTSWSARVRIPVGTKFYYLPLTKDSYTHRWSFTSNRYGSQKDALHLIEQAARRLKIDTGTIYGIKTDDVKNFGAEWINLVDVMEQELVKQIQADAETFFLAQQSVTTEMRTLYDVVQATGMDQQIPNVDLFARLYERIAKARAADVVTTYQQLSNRIPTLTKVVEKAVAGVRLPNITTLEDTIIKKYPMVHLLVGVCAESHYGGGRIQLLKKNSAKVLAYTATVS